MTMKLCIHVRPRDDGQGWAIDVYDWRRAWTKTHLGESPLNKAGCFAAERAKGITPRGKQASAVLEVVGSSPWGATAADVCSRLGVSQSAAFAALSRGVRRGELRRVEQGRYARATR